MDCKAYPVHSTPHHDFIPDPHTCRPFELLEKLTTPGHPLAEHEGRCVEVEGQGMRKVLDSSREGRLGRCLEVEGQGMRVHEGRCMESGGQWEAACCAVSRAVPTLL